MSSSFNRREFVALGASASVAVGLQSAYGKIFSGYSLLQVSEGQPVSRPSATPMWVRQGVVAASNTLAPSFVLRAGGEEIDYTEKWRADLSDAAVRAFIDQGINLIVITFYKGAGLKAESGEIAIAREFTKLAHRRGVRVGGYVGGTLLYEMLEAEEPQSKDWKQIDEFGNPIYYVPGQTFRYMACRNNPGYMAYVKKVLALGIEDLRLDMIHFDQMCWWRAPASCHCQHCRKQFRQFLKDRYSPQLALRRFGFDNVDLFDIPTFGSDTMGSADPSNHLRQPDSLGFVEVTNPLMQEWALFRAWSLGERYKELTDYIHKLNPETAVQGNPPMNLEDNNAFILGIDYGQLLQGGDMITSEEDNQPIWTGDGRLVSQIRTYKGVRTMGKSVAFWQASPRDPQISEVIPWDASATERGISEALAYNDRNLGAVVGWDVNSTTIPSEAKPYIDLFYKRSKDLVNTKTVADVAILRSYASNAFNPARGNVSTVLFEQSLIVAKIPFAIIFDRHLSDLSAYKVLVLADQDALSDKQVADIRNFVRSGGSVVATGRTSLLNEWRLIRPKFALSDVLGVDRPPAAGKVNVPHRTEAGSGRAAYIPSVEPAIDPPPAQVAYAFPNHYWKLPKNHDDLVASVRWAARERLSAEVDAPPWVTLEMARQEGGPLLLHLVNYKPGETVHSIKATIRPPVNFRIKDAVLVTPEHLTEQKLTLTADREAVAMEIPFMRVYALVVMKLEEIR